MKDGLPGALVTSLVLGVHEISHILVANSLGIKLGLPYFVPSWQVNFAVPCINYVILEDCSLQARWLYLFFNLSINVKISVGASSFFSPKRVALIITTEFCWEMIVSVLKGSPFVTLSEKELGGYYKTKKVRRPL